MHDDKWARTAAPEYLTVKAVPLIGHLIARGVIVHVSRPNS